VNEKRIVMYPLHALKAALIIFFSAAVASCSHSPATQRPTALGSFDARLNLARADQVPQITVRSRIEQALSSSGLGDVSQQGVQTWSTDELKASMRALFGAAFMSSGELARRSAADMALIFDELRLRKQETTAQVRDLRKTQLMAREFAKAEALALRYPGIDTGERVIRFSDRVTNLRTDANTAASARVRASRSVWAVNVDDHALKHVDVEIAGGVHVVAIVALQCHFSARAIADISRDRDLAELLSPALLMV
jgi:hypothetical protein